MNRSVLGECKALRLGCGALQTQLSSITDPNASGGVSTYFAQLQSASSTANGASSETQLCSAGLSYGCHVLSHMNRHMIILHNCFPSRSSERGASTYTCERRAIGSCLAQRQTLDHSQVQTLQHLARADPMADCDTAYGQYQTINNPVYYDSLVSICQNAVLAMGPVQTLLSGGSGASSTANGVSALSTALAGLPSQAVSHPLKAADLMLDPQEPHA